MKVGIAYDLREEYLAQGLGEEETAEFDRPDTIDAIVQSLHELGHIPDRIGNIKALNSRLAKGDRWDMVFNIAEGVRGFGREAQVPALLEAFDIPYTFSDPLILSLSLHKGFTKRVIRDIGIPTPDFAIIEKKSDIGNVDLEYPLFAKPIAEGTGKGIDPSSKITDPGELAHVCSKLLALFKQPVLVETFLPGREFTVGITGTEDAAVALGVLEVILNKNAEHDVYSYLNKEKCEELVEYRLANDIDARNATQIALDAWKELGCRDAGRVDIRMDSTGIPNFMEVNPLAGLNPVHSDLCILADKAGITYNSLIETILKSAIKRCRITLTR
ncbi:MAG: D-alanine--D-alanine ligase [Pseudomonadota bacterium]